MKLSNTIFSILLAGLVALTSTYAGINPDTVVTVSGTVVSADESTPLKAIIEYKSLPYGSEIGKISSNDNGEFIIYVHGGSSYSFKVTSKGYFSYNEELKLGAEQIVGMKIELAAGDVDYVFLLKNLIFDVNSDVIHRDSHAELDNNLVGRLNEYPNMVIQLEGHTDNVGNANSNMALSERRVLSVKSYLIARGIGESRVMTKAFGGTKPLSEEDTPEAHANNRRVEVRIIRIE